MISVCKVSFRHGAAGFLPVVTASTLLALLSISPTPVCASPGDESNRTYVVDAIHLRGLKRTKRTTILRLLEIEVGERVGIERIEAGIRRLRQTDVFREIDYELLDRTVPGPDGSTPPTDHRVLRLDIRERWTTLPIFAIHRTGRLDSLTAGLRDRNAFGWLLELGGQYRRLGTTNSAEAWVRAPHVLIPRLSTSLEFGWTNRPRLLYSPRGTLAGGYLRRRRYIDLSAVWNWSPTLATGLAVGGRDDHFSLDLISPPAAALQEPHGPPTDRRAITTDLHVRLGRIEHRTDRLRGMEYVHSIGGSWPILGSRFPSRTTRGTLRSFGPLPLDSLLAARFSYGFSDAKHVDDSFFVGGLSDIRGFVDSRFRGRHHWFANLEARVPSIREEMVVVQHVLFVDGGGVADRASQLWSADGTSAGAGLRILIPSLRNFTLRFDYARSLIGDGRAPISFGTSQHF